MSESQAATPTTLPQNVPAPQVVPPVPPHTMTPASAPEKKLLCLSDKIEHNFVTGINISIPTEYFGPDWINEFEASSWKKVSNSEHFEYLLRVFPGGDSKRNRGFISVQIEIKKTAFSTNETFIVSLGVRVAGDDRIKKFTFVGEDPQCIYIPQFVSHDYLKASQLATDECVKIECTHKKA